MAGTISRALLGALALMAGACASAPGAIDRQALVSRHDVVFTAVDADAPVMLGNGEFAIAVDITGLQTFREPYSRFAPLLTQAQWAWHSFPNPDGYTLEDALAPIEAHGTSYLYPWFEDWSALETNPALRWLRENPHRFSLGRVSLDLRDAAGASAAFADLSDTRQQLSLLRGEALSRFAYDGAPVTVATRVHPTRDMVLTEIASPLVEAKRLGVTLAFPYVAAQLNPDPADWESEARHETRLVSQDAHGFVLERTLDATRYWVRAASPGPLTVTRTGAHAFLIAPAAGDALRLAVEYSRAPPDEAPKFEDAAADVTAHWRRFWSRGGAIDFSGTDDARAGELERRIVLSQYLTAVNSAGSLMPQEEGLFSNSWNGKFHHEMHWWHGAHFALWGRSDLLARSMDWYAATLPQARARAAHYGRRGAWWPKMTGPDARESPSTINPFIMWQQPHPIALAELLYRADPRDEVLQRYAAVVFATADLLASYPHWSAEAARYELGPPLIPAQENYDPRTTFNPTFELAYFQYGLATAQAWRQRMGLAREPDWDRVLAHLSPLPMRDGLYLGAESAPLLWADACAPDAPRPEACPNRDHPSFVAALGLLPGDMADAAAMKRTLAAVRERWDLRQTWGWDYPMLAMSAARLGEPELAVDFLLMDQANNRYGATGMTPRFHLDGEVMVQDAATYFPSNGALLAAAAMMAAGWDGAAREAPGFPPAWRVRWEGLAPLP